MPGKHPTLNPPSAACSQASADSTSALSGQDFRRPGRSKSTPSAAPSSPTVSPMQSNIKTCVPVCQHSPASTLSSADSPAKTFRQWASGAGYQASERGCSSTQCVSCRPFNRAGWCLRMSPVSCFQTMAATSKRCLKRLPNAGMWDTGGCWTAVISESPQNAAAYSWSQVFESCPPWSSWVMPDQWRAYLARRKRAARGRTLILRCLRVFPTAQVSTYRAEISSLSKTVGIRWLSGRERLTIMGFGADWMRPTLVRLGLPETPSALKSRSGLPKN